METKCHVVISMEKEMITDKNLLYNEVKKTLEKMTASHIIESTVFNVILHSKNKQFVREEITVFELNLPRNEFPIDELEYEGKFYPFSKIRLTVDSSKNALIQYVFDGGKEELDIKLLVEEFLESIPQEN